MKKFILFVGVCFVFQLFNNVQALPHRSIEDTEEDTSTESESPVSPAVVVNITSPPSTDSHVRDMSSHESKSHEEEDGSSEEETESNQSVEADDDTVKFPKTGSLCPARPEEVTNIELECAKEYQQWKEQRAKKEKTTTSGPMEPVDVVRFMSYPPNEDMIEEMQMSTQEMTTPEMTTTEEMTTEVEDETTTEMMTTMPTTTRQSTTTTTPMKRQSHNYSGRKHKRSVRRKRSCYPATCILRKLNLLDSMGQPNLKQIQKFAATMSMDDSMDLEKKAEGCVKEINEAMIDASSDIGKKVGCVAQKVITCLNKGLTCPIMKVPQ